MLRRFALTPHFPASICLSTPVFFRISEIASFAQRAFFEETRKLEEEATFKVLMENLNRMYLLESRANRARSFLQDQLLKTSLNAKTPLKDILEHYQSKNRLGFDEEILSLSLDYLARTFKSLGKMRVSEDMNLLELHANSRFMDMVQETMYGLKEGVFFDFDKISKVFSSFLILEYKDLDLQIMCLEKITRTLKGKKEEFSLDLKDPFKNYQSFKKHYYQNFLDFEGIMQNKEFIGKLDSFLALESEDSQKDDPFQKEFHQSKEIISALLGNLGQIVEKNEIGLKRIVQSIMGIRIQYRKIKKAKDEHESLSKNANVHALFLEIEEKLVGVGMIGIDDVRKSRDFEPTEQEELLTVTRIFEDFIKEYYPESSTIFPILNANININVETSDSQPKNISNLEPRTSISSFIEKEKAIKLTKIAETMCTLAEIARLPFMETKNRDFIDEKWKRIFQEEIPQEIRYIMSEYRHESKEIKGDWILSPIYMITLKYFKEIFPEIQKVIQKESSLKELLAFSHAYSLLGLDDKSQHFLSLVTPSLFSQISTFTVPEFTNLLHTLVQSFGKIPQIVDPLLEYLSICIPDLDLETCSLAILTLCIYDSTSNNLINDLVQRLSICVEGENELHRFQAKNLKSLIFDVKMVLTSSAININKSDIQTFLKFFSGFERDLKNLKPRNPILEHFVALLKKNTATENIYHELQAIDFEGLSHYYQPEVFTRGATEIKNAIFILDSMDSSLEGARIREITRMRFKIMEKAFKKIQCRWIPSTMIYNIRENEQEVRLKSNEELSSLIEDIINSDKGSDWLGKIRVLGKVVSGLYEENKADFKDFTSNAVIMKITANLTEIFRIEQKIRFMSFELVARHYFEQVKLLIMETYNAAHLLQKPLRKNLLSKLNEKFTTTFTSLQAFFQHLSSTISPLPPLNPPNLHHLQVRFPWVGHRLTNELIPNKNPEQTKKKRIDFELVDLGFYNDHSYHQYREWRGLYRQLTESNLLFTNPQGFTGVLFSSKPEGKVFENIAAIPDPTNIKNIIRPLSYKWNWEQEFFQATPEARSTEIKKAGLAGKTQHPVNKEMNFIINLQNMKYVLKKDYSVEQVAKLLLEFNFIDGLIAEHLHLGTEESSSNYYYTSKLKRKGKDLLKYLDHPFRGSFTNDYTKFMMRVAMRREKLKELVRMRNSLKIYKDYKEGKIDLQTLKRFKENLDENIKKEITKLEDASLEFPIMSKQSMKYLDYQYDNQELLSNIPVNRSNKSHELEFIQSRGSYQKYLLKQKRKAEEKLIKAKIIKKLHEDLPLSVNEKLYLKAWRDNKLKKGSSKTTKKSIGSISEHDKEILSKLLYSSFKGCEEFPLSDLILEFSLFFDGNLIEEIDWRMQSKDLRNKWGIETKILLPSFQSKENSYLSHLYENHLFNEAGEIKPEETDLVVEMTKLLKDKTAVDRKKIAALEADIREFCKLVNPFKNRYTLFHRWLSLKMEESKQKEYECASYENQEKELKEIWLKIFQKPYGSTTDSELHSFIQGLTERLYIFTKYQPHSIHSLIKYLLLHPNLKKVDLETLVTMMDVFGLEVKLDSKEIEEVLKKKSPGNGFLFMEENIKERIQQSSIEFMNGLIGKINGDLDEY